MGADTKLLRNRIKSVNNTLHLTKAMGLVASSKIRRASESFFKSQSYVNSLNDVMNVLCSSKECEKSIFITNNSENEKIKLVVIAGDRGLAGGYNNNIFRILKAFPDADIVPIGKRACDRVGSSVISSESFTSKDSYALSKRLCEEYKNGEFTKLGIVGTKYVSMMKQDAYIEWVLPLSKETEKSKSAVIFEPSREEILETAILEYLGGIISSAVKEGFLCEVVSRRTAMDSAGKNAKQMIEDLQLSYNRARQGTITQEITEIVAGSNA